MVAEVKEEQKIEAVWKPGLSSFQRLWHVLDGDAQGAPTGKVQGEQLPWVCTICVQMGQGQGHADLPNLEGTDPIWIA